MPFAHFTNLPVEIKETKLREAFEKIASRIIDMKWFFKCVRNHYIFEELYHDTLDLVSNIRSFATAMLDDNDIESRPACYNHKPSVGGLDFLYTDLELMIDVFYQSLTNHVFTQHDHFDMLFELTHAVYAVLKALQNKYISRISQEQ